MDKTPQVAEEQLVITWTKLMIKKQSFKDTKVSVSEFSADISKSKESSRCRPIDKALHYDFSATIDVFQNHHNCYTQTDCYNPLPTLGLLKNPETINNFFYLFRTTALITGCGCGL